jgi:hypothetical protein
MISKGKKKEIMQSSSSKKSAMSSAGGKDWSGSSSNLDDNIEKLETLNF